MDCSKILAWGYPNLNKNYWWFFLNSLKKRVFRGSLRSDFDTVIDQSNVNGFSREKYLTIKINYPHLAPHRSHPQELEQGGSKSHCWCFGVQIYLGSKYRNLLTIRPLARHKLNFSGMFLNISLSAPILVLRASKGVPWLSGERWKFICIQAGRIMTEVVWHSGESPVLSIHRAGLATCEAILPHVWGNGSK